MNENQTTENFLLTSWETAAALGICKRTLYGLTKRGELPVVHIGRSVRRSVDDIRAYIKKSKKF